MKYRIELTQTSPLSGTAAKRFADLNLTTESREYANGYKETVRILTVDSLEQFLALFKDGEQFVVSKAGEYDSPGVDYCAEWYNSYRE